MSNNNELLKSYQYEEKPKKIFLAAQFTQNQKH